MLRCCACVLGVEKYCFLLILQFAALLKQVNDFFADTMIVYWKYFTWLSELGGVRSGPNRFRHFIITTPWLLCEHQSVARKGKPIVPRRDRVPSKCHRHVA